MAKSRVVLFDEYGAAFFIDDGVLMSRAMNTDESLDEVCEVSEPESQSFLDSINEQFGTAFTMQQFGM